MNPSRTSLRRVGWICLLLLPASVALAGTAAEVERELERTGFSTDEDRPEDARIPFLLAQGEWNQWRSDPGGTEHLEAARAHLRSARELRSPWPACSFVTAPMGQTVTSTAGTLIDDDCIGVSFDDLPFRTTPRA